jgi:2-dehydro-3-deoxy-L-rhamnonate dehydrogenase (NAD+)
MNQIDLKGRCAVITGGARGIGYAVAERMLESGAAVALWDVDGAAAHAAAKTLSSGGKAIALSLDITDDAAVGTAAAATIDQLGAVDILVNNAGIAGANLKTWEYTPQEFRRVLEVNVVSQYLCSRALVPHMMSRKYGRIVNVASIAGKEGNPNASAYSVSKAGVIGLTKSLGKELATHGILVNCITPAAAKTDIFKQITEQHIQYMLSKIPMGRFVEVGEIAALVAWLSSEECSFTTGGVFDISGGRATY